MRKVIKPKEGFRLLISQLWESFMERQKTHKALRILSTQVWSVEFLTAMLVKAAKVYGTDIEMELIGPGEQRLVIRKTDGTSKPSLKDDDIFDHLDDEARVNAFIHNVQRHR